MTIWSPKIGAEKGEIPTPALCLDLDRFDSNVQTMIEMCRAHNVQWRPHAKCHKSPVIGQRLVDAGACGLTCATVREANTMAEAGISDILIANMIAGPVKVAQLVDVAGKADVMICMDHPDQADAISAAMVSAKRSVRVLIEIEIGMNRVGISHDDRAIQLANHVDGLPGLKLAGIMAYEGHLLTIEDPVEKAKAIHAALNGALELRSRFDREGLANSILSCGGTGSFPITVQQEGITEIQAGGAIFMDAFYRNVCGITGLENALTVLATVGSRPTSDRAVIDAGRKSMNIEIHKPQPIGLSGVTVSQLSAEHGLLDLEPGARQLAIGQQIELIPGYADLTNVLHRFFYGFRDSKLAEVIPIVH